MEVQDNRVTQKSQEKIGKVLQKFLSPNFKIKNDVYLNLFLTHLIGKKEDSNSTLQIDEKLREQFCDYIVHASHLWEQQKTAVPTTILTFTLNLASQLSKNEQVFVKLNCQNVYETLVGIAQSNQNQDASVTHGFITLIISFLEHKSGLQWVLATTYWTSVVSLGIHAHTMYIKKKAYEFVNKLLEKTVSINNNFCVSLVQMLCKPINDTFEAISNSQNESHASIENKTLFESLRPTLAFIFEVTEPHLKSLNKEVLTIFTKSGIQEKLTKFLLLSQSDDFSFELIRIQLVLQIFLLCVKFLNLKQITQDSGASEFKALINGIQREMDKDHVKCVIKTVHYAHILNYYMSNHLPVCKRGGEKLEFPNQMIVIQLLPVIAFNVQLLCDANGPNEMKLGKVKHLLINDDYRREFIRKLIRMSDVQTMEMCYRWKERLRTNTNLIEYVTYSFQFITKIKKYINRERAAMYFQPLVYCLRDSFTYMQLNPKVNMSARCEKFFDTLMETVIDLVETFDLTWKDSIETISVLSLACEFLHYPYLTSKLLIRGMKLKITAINKYMSPHMVLLMDGSKDSQSPVRQTVELLYAKCHDSSWEIRDSALEVIFAFSSGAKKFCCFKNVLIDTKFPELIVQMALKDGEYYVRASAFKCLQEMIQIPDIWEILLNIDSFLDNILEVFKNETEGVVRKEAATLVCKIHATHEFSEETLSRMYDVMTHAVTGDLHWEVKVSALDFWQNTVEKHLVNQGMIDKDFPAVTFSKEHKKIVTLTEIEIRKRLIKVLNQLAHTGCLSVLKSAVEDDCDIEVSKKATACTLHLVKLFKKYHVPCENVNLSHPPSPLIEYPITGLLSPSTSATLTADSPLSIPYLDSPIQYSNPPSVRTSLFDALSPFPNVLSPSLDLDLDLTNPSSPSTVLNPVIQSQIMSSSSEPTVNEARRSLPYDTPSSGDSGLDTIGSNQMDIDSRSSENHVISQSFDPGRTEKMLEDMLMSNDMTLLQGIYNPSDQNFEGTTQMKTKAYLKPSDYLKFIYNQVENHANQKSQWQDSLDQFDSLLDDILKEYNIDSEVNDMDCY